MDFLFILISNGFLFQNIIIVPSSIHFDVKLILRRQMMDGSFAPHWSTSPHTEYGGWGWAIDNLCISEFQTSTEDEP
jgi:hypothetical protein